MRAFVTLSWLYLVQGIPYGLQDKFIPIQLRSLGLNYSSVSLLKLLLLPWIAKGIWAPVVEVCGGKHCWLVVSVMGLGISSLAGSFITPNDVMNVGIMLISLNIFSAVQDVAVDGLAIQMLPDNQLGLGNTLQVVLYKVGSLVGGAGLTYLVTWSCWSTSFTILAFVYVLTGVWAYSLPFRETVTSKKPEQNLVQHSNKDGEPLEVTNLYKDKTEKQLPIREITSHKGSYLQLQRMYSIVKEVINSSGTLWISLYVLLYKMGERGAINNLPLYLLDRGFSKERLSFWNGTVCQGLSVLGSVHGGVALKSHSSIRRILLKYSICRFLIVSLQCFVIFMFEQNIGKGNYTLYFMSVLSLCLLSYNSGVVSTATFTFMMMKSRDCSQESQASHYSVLASIEVAGKLLFASLAGFSVDYFGMLWTFLLFTFLCILPVVVLYAIPHKLYGIKKE